MIIIIFILVSIMNSFFLFFILVLWVLLMIFFDKGIIKCFDGYMRFKELCYFFNNEVMLWIEVYVCEFLYIFLYVDEILG